jgi:hypothetical protein
MCNKIKQRTKKNTKYSSCKLKKKKKKKKENKRERENTHARLE